MKSDTETSIAGPGWVLLASVLLVAGGFAPAGHGAEPPSSDAMSILKGMSDYVSSQQTIELAFDSDIEIITPELEKIQFTNSGTALVSRPDKLRAHRVGGYADVELVFDGATVSVFGRNINSYTQFAVRTRCWLRASSRPSTSAAASSAASSASTSPSATPTPTGSCGWRWARRQSRARW
jgi:hypothetical protein